MGTLNFVNGMVVGNKLIIGPGKNTTIIEYDLQPDGSLKGRRTEGGKPAGTISMKRMGN